MAELIVDVSKKSVGDFIGGAYRVVRECPKCKRPGATNGRVRILRSRQIEDFVHLFHFALNKKNDPVMTPSDICVWERP